MGYSLVRIALLSITILVAGCGDTAPPPPTAAEAAKTPPVPAPKGADAARDESFPK